MKKEQLKRKIQKIKEQGMERKQKIKKLVVQRKDDFLTALEKNWRDAALKPLTTFLWNRNITANKIGWFSVFLLATAIFMHIIGYSFPTQFFLLVIVALIDGLDGPLARNHNNVTIHGTWLDHLRDGALVAWATYLIYAFNLLSLQTIIILWSLQAVLIWITAKDFLIRYIQKLSAEEEEVLLTKFTLDNLQASVIGRIQFFCWTVSYGFLIGSLLAPIPYAQLIGQVLISLAIIFSALNILEAYQKSI